jgi:hypothetical protein
MLERLRDEVDVVGAAASRFSTQPDQLQLDRDAARKRKALEVVASETFQRGGDPAGIDGGIDLFQNGIAVSHFLLLHGIYFTPKAGERNMVS